MVKDNHFKRTKKNDRFDQKAKLQEASSNTKLIEILRSSY